MRIRPKYCTGLVEFEAKIDMTRALGIFATLLQTLRCDFCT
jgi:hypothetical protein